MVEEPVSDAKFRRFVRSCIYNRWFYAVLALVCLLDVVTDVVDILHPTANFVIVAISLVASAVAAVLTTAVFLDLHFRRGKL
jgi:hypothetical protein